MYIEPNTTIRILRNVPLDSTYEHTIYFTSRSAQESYFTSKAKYTLQKQTYQRTQRGYMRVQLKAELLYDCNYLMYQNTAFGEKWFYAFIKSVEYINNEVSQVQFELDVMQSWFFDYKLGECFVEREHSDTDGLFENLVPENIDLGDDYISNKHDEFDMNDMNVCILIGKKQNQAGYQGKTINNIYTPLNIIAGVPASDHASIDALLNSYVDAGQEDRVAVIYQYPAWLGDATNTEAKVQNKTITPNLSTIDGYTPKNRKLYSYPYNFLMVSNNCGQTAEYKYEDWKNADSRGRFKIAGVFISTPAVMLYPLDYRGIWNDYDSGLTISNFPQCAWVGDAFKKWWAENKMSATTANISSVLGSGLTIGASLLNPAYGALSASGQFLVGANALNSGLNAASSVASTLAKSADLKNTPPQIHGQIQTDSLNCGIGRVKFDFYFMSIKSQFAKIIDDYFSRYGYATHRTKVPNRYVRPHWCYTKTIGCTITGSIPADDAKKICAIYNAGVTFWVNGDEIGNYSLNNSLR